MSDDQLLLSERECERDRDTGICPVTENWQHVWDKWTSAPVFWSLASTGSLPGAAISIGHILDTKLYLARIPLKGGMQVGYVDMVGDARVSYGGIVITSDVFEVLCFIDRRDKDYSVTIATVPMDRLEPNEMCIPIEAGWERSGNPLFGAVVEFDEQDVIPGKFSVGNQCHYPNGNEESCSNEFKVVCVKISLNENGDSQDARLEIGKQLSCTGFQMPFHKPRLFLLSIDELLLWVPSDTIDRRVVDCSSRECNVIMCHDMMGGYCLEADENYLETFSSWDKIDAFIYFGHFRISIPPLVWIQECQKRNVPSLGTIITEGESGSKDTSLLVTENKCVDKLVALCKFYGFDGYLFNMESDFKDEIEYEMFVSMLRRLKCSLGPSSKIIVYDSVCRTGRVSYQNSLNAENLPLFDACDGLFTNYWWTDNTLEISKVNAKDRVCDVFVGVDVWARGKVAHMKGFGCRDAIRTIRSAGLSVAVFAPGWTKEAGPSKGSDSLKDQRLQDRMFWEHIFS